MTKIGLIGVSGRMGQAILSEILSRDGAEFASGCEASGHGSVGKPVRNPLTGDLLDMTVESDPKVVFAASDVVIDFSTPDALETNLVLATSGLTPMVIGTTGLQLNHHRLIDEVATDVAIMQAANTSLGVTLLASLVRQTAMLLDPSWDIEIVEMHYRHKTDAPSGTALLLGEKAAEGRHVEDDVFVKSRVGETGPRAEGAIGFSTLRGGDGAGEHSVIFAADAERVELSHKATDRKIFARGAVTAAQWINGLPAGRYTMDDVLGLT